MKRKIAIDLGLAILATKCRYGEPKTCAEIAAYCETSPARIQQIEAAALAKLRRKGSIRDLAVAQFEKADDDVIIKRLVMEARKAGKQKL